MVCIRIVLDGIFYFCVQGTDVTNLVCGWHTSTAVRRLLSFWDPSLHLECLPQWMGNLVMQLGGDGLL